MSKRFYITTAIDYVNGHPHLGHAYEKVVADVIARSRRSLGQETFFLTGLDEHGQKVQQAAVAEGKTPQAYCDELAAVWKAFAAKLELTNDDFVRTTEPRHKQVVQTILAKLHAEGHFYKEVYRGFYSTREETFLTDKDRLPDGTFDPAWGKVIELDEENYYFRLKDHQQWLIDYIEQNPDVHCARLPAQRGAGLPEEQRAGRPVHQPAGGALELGHSRCPSIPTTSPTSGSTPSPTTSPSPPPRATPACPTPFALNPQPSTLNSPLWPADIHLIGKDIVKFHAVYWPIMLKAMGAPLPKQVLVHGWWQKDGQRMSKSTGNVVDPVAVIDEWGVDAFRFYVLRELDIGPDGNWTEAGFKARYSAELANGLGNLVNRSLSMLKRYRNGVVPKVSNELAPEAEKVIAETRALLEQNQLQGALQSIWSLVTRANQYVDHTAPFKLAKDPSKAERLDEVLYNLAEVCRILAVLLWPFLPGTAAKIYAQLGLAGAPDKFSEARWGGLAAGHAIGAPAPLFPRKEV